VNRAERRASGVDYPSSLTDWSHDKIVTITLDAIGGGPARVVDFELPDLVMFATRGMLPNPLLREMALKVDNGLTPGKLTEEEQGTYFDLMAWIIATGLRRPDLVSELGGAHEAAEWVATQMPPAHRIAIWQRAVHIFSPEDLLRFFEATGGVEDTPGSEVSSVSDLATFPRHAGGGPVPDGDGAAGD
jgi:hypothetical protein